MACVSDSCKNEQLSSDQLDNDFRHLHEIKSFLIEELRDFQAGTLGLGCQDNPSYDRCKGLVRKFPDGRKVRTLLPHGHEWSYNTILSPRRSEAHDAQIWFVGFLGEKRKDVQVQEITAMVSSINEDLNEELQEYPSMVSVCTAETCKGNYSNLVLMLGEQTLSQWHSSRLHRFAVRELAPRYYSKVRIHIGQLPNGLEEEMFHLKRTIFLDFTAYQEDNKATISRNVQHWKPGDATAPTPASCKLFVVD